jgi:hypothetical protein
MKGEPMFCPNCHAEYLPGVTECADCGVKLVAHLEPEREPVYVEPVTVLKTSNQSELMIAKSLLEGEGIEYFAKGDGLVDFVAGRLGFNPVIGAIEIQVHPDDEERAREVLAEMQRGDFEVDNQEGEDEEN